MGIHIETFRDPGIAYRFARRLEKMGLHPLVLDGSPDKYGRITHDVIWTGVR
jgi:hypothetical protein